VAISADGQYIAAGSVDSIVFLFDGYNNENTWSYKTSDSIVAISSAERYIVAGNNTGRIYLFY
jgi:WD40 repeat protein